MPAPENPFPEVGQSPHPPLKMSHIFKGGWGDPPLKMGTIAGSVATVVLLVWVRRDLALPMICNFALKILNLIKLLDKLALLAPLTMEKINSWLHPSLKVVF